VVLWKGIMLPWKITWLPVMISTFLFAFSLMLIVVAGMAIGVFFGRAPISGSCGGMKALGLEMECEICGGDPGQCESSSKPGIQSKSSALANRVGR
jgi:hypothetical protein